MDVTAAQAAQVGAESEYASQAATQADLILPVREWEERGNERREGGSEGERVGRDFCSLSFSARGNSLIKWQKSGW